MSEESIKLASPMYARVWLRLTKQKWHFRYRTLLHAFLATVQVLLISKALKEEGWMLKYAIGIFVIKLYGFCLNVLNILRTWATLHSHRESTDSGVYIYEKSAIRLASAGWV